ncbi:hypothetical protein Tco_1212857 [Tanacetum coccineum]
MDTAYRTSGYGVSDLLGMAYWATLVRCNKVLGYGILDHWIRRISSLGMVFCISWVWRIELLGYGVLAKSVLFLIFDQSIIYDVYTDVDTVYSSKSENGLLIRQSLGYILEDIKRGPYSKKSPIRRIPHGWIRRIDAIPDTINT